MKDSIQFGSHCIRFELEYSNRKTLGITVAPDMNVKVRAPLSADQETIRKKVMKKAGWILRQQSFFLSYQPISPPKQYVGGETHLYLGRQYRLSVRQGNEESVRLKGAFIEVIASDKTIVRNLVQNWYLNRAKELFSKIAQPLIDRFKSYNVVPESIVLQSMPTRWGSCTPSGKIILNPDLIRAPKACIEYVIIHELCHLVHHNHSDLFFDLQTKEMKEWTKWKNRLEKLLA